MRPCNFSTKFRSLTKFFAQLGDATHCLYKAGFFGNCNINFKFLFADLYADVVCLHFNMWFSGSIKTTKIKAGCNISVHFIDNVERLEFHDV